MGTHRIRHVAYTFPSFAVQLHNDVLIFASPALTAAGRRFNPRGANASRLRVDLQAPRNRAGYSLAVPCPRVSVLPRRNAAKARRKVLRVGPIPEP